MSTEEREQELRRWEERLRKREQELRLIELEREISPPQHEEPPTTTEPPLHKTRKHEQSEGKLQVFGRKLVRYAKFGAFIVLGFTIIRLGIILGIWISYAAMLALIGWIGYETFLRDDKSDRD